MESLMIKNNSERDFRWPGLTILANDTVEVHQDKLKEIPVLNKLLKARELEIVGAQGCVDEKKEAKEKAVEKKSTKDSKKDKKAKEKAKEEDEDVSSVLKSLK